MPNTNPRKPEVQLSQWKVSLEGDWTEEEIRRIWEVFLRLADRTGSEDLASCFNGQTTRLHHSGRPGRAGYTRGADIYLNDAWTDWTLAHELGHRWNNAWDRQPQQSLQRAVRAGRVEWLKAPLRRSLKKIEKFLQKHWGFKGRLDWRALWYHPGSAPPPCGVDRNFNPSEDLAECFAAALFPADARSRANRAAKKLGKHGGNWDWGRGEAIEFEGTERGQFLTNLLSNH